MKKRYLYTFHGNMMVEAQNQDEAEKLVQGQDICYFILDDEVFEIDQFRIAYDLKKRKKQIETTIHPVEDLDEFNEYKIRKHKYSLLFNDFIQCKIDRKELLEKMDQAENKKVDSTKLYQEIIMIILEPYEQKTIRFFYVGEMP